MVVMFLFLFLFLMDVFFSYIFFNKENIGPNTPCFFLTGGTGKKTPSHFCIEWLAVCIGCGGTRMSSFPGKLSCRHK
jgi:hypothetical protein